MALMSSFLQGGEVFMALMSSYLWALISSFLQVFHGSNELLLAGLRGLHGSNELLLAGWGGLDGSNELLRVGSFMALMSSCRVGRSSWL